MSIICKFKESDIPNGYICDDCKHNDFCHELFKDRTPNCRKCQFTPCMFEKKRTINHDCYFFVEGDTIEPRQCTKHYYQFRFCTSDFDCAECKDYITNEEVNNLVITHLNERK